MVQAQVSASVAIGLPSVRVAVAPPPLQVETRPPCPSPNHLWVSGYWRWQGGKHIWAPGSWQERRPGQVWVDSSWTHERGQWGFHEGRWIASEHPYHREEIVATAPPPPEVEVVPATHDLHHEWIGGHYEWHGGHHVWLPGRYEERPAGLHWEGHRWDHMEDGRYRFHRGEWRH
jgi:hypothetical protein